MNRYSLFGKFFISLVILLIVPIVIIGFVSGYAMLHYSEEEISKNSIGKLKVAVNTSKQLAEFVSKDAIKISINNVVNGLNDLSVINKLKNIEDHKLDIDELDNLMTILRIQDILREMVRTNNAYHSVYLYLRDFQYTITSDNGLVPNNILQDMDWMRHYRNFTENKTQLSWIRSKVPQNIDGKDTGSLVYDDVITYIYPLTPYTTNLNGAIVINIKEDALNNLINSNNFDSEGYICIINNKGELVSHIDSREIFNEVYADKIINNKLQEGYVVTKAKEKNFLISYYKSDFNGWIYLGVFPLSNLMGKANAVLTNTIYIYLLIVVLGVIVSYGISKRLYNPFKNLIQDIKSAKGIDFKDNQDELVLLDKVFDSLIKQENSLFDVLEKNKRNIFESYLMNLLKGSQVDMAYENTIGVNFIYPYYVCSIISIDRYREFVKAYGEEQQYYMKVLILKVAEEILNIDFLCAGIDIGKGEIALIINVRDKDDAGLYRKLGEKFFNIQQEIGKILDYSISIGIGCCHEGRERIKVSYSEAQEAVKLKLKSGHGSINTWKKEVLEYVYYYPFSDEEHILNYLNMRLADEIILTINELVDEIKNKDNLSCDNITQIFNQLVGNTIIKYLVNTNINIKDIFGISFNIYGELSKKETLDEIKDWLCDTYVKIIDYCNESRYANQYSLDKIMSYISENYRNDIGISHIAEYVGLSYSHVRKIFKDATGKNIIDYINEIRIREAKKLLIETDMTIKDIALYLGYNNDQSFNRFFKKYEGITPGDYRSKNAVRI